MSEENVEALRWLYAQWAKGDLWALREVADPSIEWEWSARLASLSGGPRVYRGLEQVAAATREWLAAWDRYWMTAEDFIEVGDDVVVLMDLHGRAARTGLAVEARVAAVWRMRHGQATQVRYYDDTAEALEAVGLSE